MKIASVKEVKDNLSQFLKKAEQEDIVITKNGRPTAILHHLGEDELEDYLLEHDPKFKRKIEKRWKDYLKNGGTSLATLLKGLAGRVQETSHFQSNLPRKLSAKLSHCQRQPLGWFSRKFKMASCLSRSKGAKSASSGS